MADGDYKRCQVDGCTNAANRVGAGMCEMHYYRVRRSGCADPRPLSPIMQSGGYLLVKVEHPLKQKNGWVYQHRQVAYDTNAGVCPSCNWCGAAITWKACHIDHLNGDKADNRAENLVVSCSQCNRMRGAAWPFLLGLTDAGREQLVALLDAQRNAGQGASKV